MSLNNYTKEQIYKMSVVEIYKLILQGKYIEKFPNGFWKRPDAMNNAKIVTKYLIEEYLKLSDEKVKDNISLAFFKKYRLGGMLTCCFNNSPYLAMNNAYGDKYKPWEFKSVSMGYWNDDTCRYAIRWLIEEKLKLSDEEIKEQLSQELFYNNGLTGMLTKHFKGSPVKAINHLYPNKFKPWEFKTVGYKYWNNETLINAIKWLIEEKLKLTDEEIKEQLSTKLFKDNGLVSILNYINNSPYDAINLAYPNKFNRSDFKNYK